jgi:transmembrane sensor
MITGRSEPPINKQIIEEAAEWFVEINEGEADNAARERFHAWLSLSPQHVRAYLELLPHWEDAARLSPESRSPEALIAEARARTSVTSLATAEPSAGRIDERSTSGVVERSLRFRRSGVLALAASVLVVVAGFWVWTGFFKGLYHTATGEQRLIALSDGSRVELNARSRLRVRFGERERLIELLEGQALFQVAKDSARPFIVQSGSTSVRAVGTQFDVYRKGQDTIVTVIEGKISVATPAMRSVHAVDSPRTPATEAASALMLSAGEQVVVAPAMRPAARRANVAAITAWREQRLVFSRTPLTEVAEEFNRYNERQLIVILDPQRGDFKISGTFSSTDPAALIGFLRAQPELRVDELDEEIRISVTDAIEP